MKANSILTFFASCLLLGCGAGDSGELTGGPGAGGGETPAGEETPAVDPDDPAQCQAREYLGFDSVPLHAGRVAAKIGVDRGRMKPFSALGAEYTRVLGNTPASLQGAAATFGQPPARWYEEPEANAVALQTAYSIAFDGCLTYTASGSEFASAPDATSAPKVCADMARKFWSKTPSTQEIEACASVATTGAATEPQARRKWAYACAAVLTSAGFLTY